MVEALSIEYYGNSLLRWLIAAVSFIVVAGGLAVARFVVLRTVKPSSKVRAFFRVAVSHTRYVFLAVVGASVASTAIDLPVDVPNSVLIGAKMVVILQVGWWIHGMVTFWSDRSIRKRSRSNLGSVTTMRALGAVIKAGVWFMVGIALLGALGVNVTAMVAGLGVGGIAIALAVQSIIGDVFASVSIILDKPFVVGDMIKVGEQVGRVEAIGVKTTRLRSLSGEQLIMGNGDMLSSRIQNFRRMTERRVLFTIGVEYGTPPETVAAIPGMIRVAIEEQDPVRIDRVHFKEYGDSSLNFECVYYVLAPEYNVYMDIQQGINLSLYKKFTESEIGFAFPTRTLHLKMPAGDAGSVTKEETPAPS